MKMKKSYKQQAAVVILAALSCASCSDKWDEHYSEAKDGVINTTLWQAIESKPDLSHFAKVIKACGYDAKLDGSQTYTVFALTNSGLSESTADSLVNVYNKQKATGVKDEENTVIKQVLQNHIALYKKSVSTTTNDSLRMMNGKYQMFTPTSIGGGNFETKNVLYNNGILYTIGNALSYAPNIAEYLATDEELDSINKFVKSFGVYEFDASQSVPGGIVDGKTQYLDSVTVYNNAFYTLYGYINSEDSTYWVLAPTNAEWNRLVEEYTPYFNYDTRVDDRDSLQFTNARLAIVRSAFFNRSGQSDIAFQDSAVSTYAEMRKLLSIESHMGDVFYKPFASGGIFEGTKDISLSNGHIRKASNFRISKFDTFLKTISCEAEQTLYQDTLYNAIDPMTVRSVLSNNPFYGQVSGNLFVEISPDALGAQPSVTFKIPDVLSNVAYDIYAIFVPALAYDTLATEDQRLPVKFRAQVGYQQSGVTKWERNASFTTKADVIDTIKIKSNYKFKTASWGLSDYQAKVKIYTDVPTNQTSKYQTTMRIDCIIVKPHDAPVSEAKEYKVTY